MTAFHRGAAVRQQSSLSEYFETLEIASLFSGVRAPEPSWKVQNRAREQHHAACWDALEQFGKSSYRNRRRKAGPITRYGVSR